MTKKKKYQLPALKGVVELNGMNSSKYHQVTMERNGLENTGYDNDGGNDDNTDEKEPVVCVPMPYVPTSYPLDHFPASKDGVESNSVSKHKHHHVMPEHNGIQNTGYDHEGNREEMPKKEPVNQVGAFELFRFADCLDIILMILGILGASGTGAALPCLLIVFGSMMDLFVENSINDHYLSELSNTCKTILSEYGVTVNDIVQNHTALRIVLGACNLTGISGRDPYTILTGDYNLVIQMKLFSVYYAIIGVGVLLCAYGQVSTFLIASHRQTQRLRVTLFRSIMRQETGWFDCQQTGELNTRLSEDVNKIQEGLGDKISNFFQWMSTFAAGIIIGFCYSWKMTLVILSCGPLLAAGGGFMTWLSTAATTKELSSYAKAGAVAEEVFGAIRTVVAFGGEQKEVKRYVSHLDTARKQGIRKGAITGGGMGFVVFINFAVYALAFWFGGKLVRDGEISVGDMLLTFAVVLIGCSALGQGMPNLQNFSLARGAAYTIWQIIDKKSLIDSSSTEGLCPQSMAGNVTINNVHFKYPSRSDVPILNGLSLSVNVGQTAALVGNSGCGKSTVIQLLQRFYDPLEGTLAIDGHELRTLNIKWLRQHIGVVSQEPVLFATTIAENIGFGRDGVTQAEIEMACKNANAFDFITKLPKGFETILGERGSQLSGGQKQRIAIARALVRNPKILLLDEATSALDNESEAIVQDALEKASTGRTTIVIAHRLSTIKNADVIFGVKDGVIHESGTHQQLMDLGATGIYYQLVTNQRSTTDGNDMDLQDDEAQPSLVRQTTVEESGRKISRVRSLSESQVPATNEEVEITGNNFSIMRLMRLNAPEWKFIALGCIGAIFNGAVQPSFAILFSEILEVLGSLDINKEARLITRYSLLFLFIGVIAGFSMLIQVLMFSISGEALTLRLRRLCFIKTIGQDTSFFDKSDNSTGEICTRLATDASAVQGATGSRLGSFFQSVASLGMAIGIGFYFSWQLTLLIIAFVPFIVCAGALQMALLKGHATAGREALESAGKVAIEGIENIRTVACLTKEDWFFNEYSRLTSKPYKSSITKAHFIGLAFSFSQAAIYFTFAACFYLGAYLVDQKGLAFQDMFSVFIAMLFGAMAVGEASQFVPDYGKAKVSAVKVFELLDTVSSIDSESPDGEILNSVVGQVSFKDVHFAYPNRPEVKVLQGLDISVDEGQTLALVGSSGCGKSTSVALLERFYDPSAGTVALDGHDIKSLNLQWLRRQMGIVQQEPILFGTSIKENIAYGDNQRQVPMDEIIQAAQNANIHSFIASLPEGYETNVGDKGAQLSGGQKQRVAIARALLRNPKILLLDEATSALDTESEKVVQEALDRAQQGRTSVVIAHRLSTIQNADKIVVIHHGEIAEIGTHSELLAKKGLYCKLHLAQQKKKDKRTQP